MRWRPVLLLAMPIVLIAAGTGYSRIQAKAAREGLLQPETMSWTVKGKPAELRMQRTTEGELERFQIQVLAGGATLEELEFSIDHDMFGGGFVGGLDVDGDGEAELVMADRRGPAASRLVEPTADGIVIKSFKDLPEHYWQRIKPRLDQVGPTGSAMLIVGVGMLWLAIGLLVYLAIGTWLLIKAVIGR